MADLLERRYAEAEFYIFEVAMNINIFCNTNQISSVIQ
jgi:hypothetical protein